MGGNSSKEEPLQLKRESEIDDADFEDLGRYQGNKKDGKRHGQGIYFFNNGDIYDGEWRKGRKEGYGTYQFADGKKNIGWFYRDEYVGKEANEKLKRKMRKKRMSFDEDHYSATKATDSQSQTPQTPAADSDSEEENKNIPKLKDSTGLDLRRAESMRRQQYFRAKYNISDQKNNTEAMTSDARGLRESVRAKWGLKRSKSCTTSTGQHRKDPRLLTKEEEQLEREHSRRQRQSIRARYNLNSASE